MNRDESIALAVKLGKEYEHLAKLEENITDLDRRIASPADVSRKHFSIFTYFSKFLIGSIITLGAMSVPAFFYISVANFLVQSGQEEYRNYPLYIVLIVVFVFALIHFIGGFCARKKLKQMNQIEEDRVNANLKLKKEQKATLEDLITQYDDHSKNLSSYNDLVPPLLRSKEGMNKIKFLLLQNKADTFEQAVDLLKTYK